MSGNRNGESGRQAVPRHVAIIMDGNGRWAEQRGLKRADGHEEGSRIIEEIVDFCGNTGISQLTLFAFSIDNWKRPRKEVNYLMKLLKRYLREKKKTFMERNVKLRIIGRRSMLDKAVMKQVDDIEYLTRANDGIGLNLAVSYGGQEEIVDAVKSLVEQSSEGTLAPGEVDVKRLQDAMETGDLPSPDILIRTGGEYRLSNFLLWQLSYAELFFTDTLWPDFTIEEMKNILSEFSNRNRRFGDV